MSVPFQNRILPYGQEPPPTSKIPGYKSGSYQSFTPQQMGFFQRLQGLAGPDSFTSRLASGDQSQFAQMEAPALQQFAGLQGNLASRFSGMGEGARNSSGFKLSSNQAASDFAQQLQSRRLGLQQQAVRDLSGLYAEILGQKPYEQYFMQKQPKKPSFMSQIFGGLGQAAGLGLGAFTGGVGGGLASNFTSRLLGG